MAEAEDACIRTPSTAPGKDGLTAMLLQLAWPAIGEAVRTLYEACLRHSCHPQVFKTAEVVMLPKVGKSDFTKFKSWRPISLLSCLGKGLERLVARRMAV